MANFAGYLTVMLAMLVVNLVPPIPAEAAIPFTAALFDQHGLSVVFAIVAATIGLTLGTLPLYVVGRMAGETRCKRLLDRYGHWLAVTSADIERSGRWFARHGGMLVLVGRPIPGMRSMISIPAGFHAMPFARFIAYTVAGCGAWASVLILAGRWLSQALAGVTALRITLALLLLFAAFYAHRLVVLRRAR